MNFRLMVSATFSYLAVKIAPRELKSITAVFPSLLRGLREELAKGRDGGVAIIPWSINQRGKDLSKVQSYVAFAAVDKVRADWAKSAAAVK
jgi:hypothetical protein